MSCYTIPIYTIALVREGTQRIEGREHLSTAMQATQVFADYLDGRDREHLVVLMLDSKLRLIGINTVSIGTIDSAMVSPRDVYKAAILCNAASIMLAHNHPSGDPTPSPADISVTRIIAESGKLLGIPLLDHIIIGSYGSFTSLVDKGYL